MTGAHQVSARPGHGSTGRPRPGMTPDVARARASQRFAAEGADRVLSRLAARRSA